MADPEEKDGGTPDPKTYSEEEVATLKEEAKKEGASGSWSHFQSEADKQIAAFKNEGSAREAELTKTINSMKATQIETLPVEERTRAMVEELYKDRVGASQSSAPAPDSKATNDASEVSTEDYSKQMQKNIGSALTDMGLDPDKINWGEGQDGQAALKTFLGSVVDQVKAGQSGSGSDAGDGDKKDNPDAKPGENNVDISRGAGKTLDVFSAKPQEIMALDGAWKPIRGMIEE